MYTNILKKKNKLHEKKNRIHFERKYSFAYKTFNMNRNMKQYIYTMTARYVKSTILNENTSSDPKMTPKFVQ